VDLVLLVLLGGAMTWSMLRQPAQPFFRPVILAFLPLMIMVSPMMWTDGWIESPEVKEAKLSWKKQIAQLPVPEGVSEEDFQKEMGETLHWLVFFLPGGTLVLWLAGLTLLGWGLRRFLAARGKVVPSPPLILWRAPDWMVWLFLVPALVVLPVVNGWVADPDQKFLRAGGNWVFLVAAVYFFQGVQVMRWRLTKMRAAWIIWLALGFTVLVLGRHAFVSLGVSLALIGISDLWFDFRRLVPPSEPKDGPQGGKA
jgi:hypothetical protein